jgi:hypothetical protein
LLQLKARFNSGVICECSERREDVEDHEVAAFRHWHGSQSRGTLRATFDVYQITKEDHAMETFEANNKMANFLGWFSVGLGALELAAPRRLGRMTGVGDHAWITRAFGAREVAAGVGLLTQKSKAPWIWFRIAGDALDVAAMGLAMKSDKSKPSRIAVAAAAVAPIVILDVLCARNLPNNFMESTAQANMANP